ERLALHLIYLLVRGQPISHLLPYTPLFRSDKVAGFEAGADDYLTKPTHPAELASRVKAILARNVSQRPVSANRGTTIGVLGVKGGVGTTTIALNIAAARLMAGENPIIADFRLGNGSLGLQLGLGHSE